MLCARHGRPGWSGTEAGAQARPGAGPRTGSGASRIDGVGKVLPGSHSDEFQDRAILCGKMAPELRLGRSGAHRPPHVVQRMAIGLRLGAAQAADRSRSGVGVRSVNP